MLFPVQTVHQILWKWTSESTIRIVSYSNIVQACNFISSTGPQHPSF
eukprot:UN20712